MTQPTNTFDSYDAIGNREDLSNIIYNIDPIETPFMTLVGKGTASNTLHEWQTDSLAAASTSNAAVEGDDASGASLTATTRVTNRTQISQKTVVVSGTQNSINTAGRDKEFAYQKAKAMQEIKRDMEAIITGNQTAVTGDATTARKLRSLESWYTTNTSRGTNGSSGSSTQAATDATTAGLRAFTEDLLKTVINSAWTAGGQPDVIMTGAVNKQRLSGFAGNATAFRKAEDMKLFTAVDVYVSDFGEMKVVPNRFSRSRTVHVLDTSKWGIAYLRPFQETELAKVGDADKAQIIVEYTLEAKNQAASGVIADLSIT